MLVRSAHLRRVVTWVIILAAGCSEPTDPTLHALEGTYVLQSVDGVPVPVLQLEYTFTRQYLLTDTLWADGRGNYTRATITATDSVERPFRTIQRTIRTGTYVIRGDTVDFPFVCPFGAMCISPPVGWRLNGGEWAIAEFRTTVGFARVSRFLRIGQQ